VSEDDELLARLKKLDAAMSPHPSKDPVMRLPRGEEVRLSPDDMITLGLAPLPVEPCRARARVNRAFATGQYSISVAVPEMIFCGRPKGHNGDHYSCPPPAAGIRQIWRRHPATSDAGGWCHHWKPKQHDRSETPE
jgi:hypothetical protein